MRKTTRLLASVLVLAIIGAGVFSVYNSDNTVKKSVDNIFDKTKAICSETAESFNDLVANIVSGTVTGSIKAVVGDNSDPAVPVGTKITSSMDEDQAQSVVEPAISSEDLKSEWGDTGVKGLSVYEYGKTLLNDDEKKLYIQMLKSIHDVEQIANYKTKITPTQLEKIYSYLMSDHAEIFYLKSISSEYTQVSGYYKYKIEFMYEYGGSQKKIYSMRDAYGKKALEIVNSVKDLSTDLKKEKSIHDKVLKNCSYDVEAVNDLENHPEVSSPYGVLVNGKAICQGYAQTMKILLSSAGIKTLYVSGSSEGESHAWNMVYIGGKWKYLDATFDDPVYVDSKGKYVNYNKISYTYFNYVSDKDHSLWKFNASDPFAESSGNYEKMPKATK